MSTELGEHLGSFSDAKKDAIHVAVAPVHAREVLKPGQKIWVSWGAAYAADDAHKAVGVVDPFLTADIQPGTWFWCVLNPHTVSDLRHNWSHPAFLEDDEGGDGDDSCRNC